MTEKLLTNRRFKDGDNTHRPWVDEIFTADASHELKTPIALMQAEVGGAADAEGLNNQQKKDLYHV